MHKIFTIIRIWLGELLAEQAPADPLASLSARELADLPVYHPQNDRCLTS
jgi:hypothetical protein